MLEFIINGKNVSAKEGLTIYEIAKGSGFEIPALCYLKGHEHFTSCMLCGVKDLKSGKIIPSCSVYPENGMEIDTESDEVINFRKNVIELLLSEHIGDCFAPCQLVCPVKINIPLIIKYICKDNLSKAGEILIDQNPLPSILCEDCQGFCEKGCRRNQIDLPISIRKINKYLIDNSHERKKSNEKKTNEELRSKAPRYSAEPNKKIAIIGSGVSGLSIAFYLLKSGHDCVVFEKEAAPGGKLKNNYNGFLSSDLDRLRNIGIEFKLNLEVGMIPGFEDIVEEYDAIVIAVGNEWANIKNIIDSGSSIDKINFNLSNNKKIFFSGIAVYPGKEISKKAGHAKNVANSVNNLLSNIHRDEKQKRKPFNSFIGKLTNDEIEYFKNLKTNIERKIETSKPGENKNFSFEELKNEVEFCLDCDCVKYEICKLRIYGEKYCASVNKFKSLERKNISIAKSKNVIFDEGKCVKCGICVRITKAAKETAGFTFIGRGLQVKVGPPFNKTIKEALGTTADECIEKCPTGALYYEI